MDNQSKIRDLMNRGEVDDNIVATIDNLMNFRHQQFSEIMNMPYPLVEAISKRIQKEKEAEAKAWQKKR